MARDRLHIICGNCGCNDMFSWEIAKESNERWNGYYIKANVDEKLIASHKDDLLMWLRR